MARRRDRKLPPARSWTEEVDGHVVVGCAVAQEIRRRREYDSAARAYIIRRWLYVASAFAIVDRGKGWGPRARLEATARLEQKTGGLARKMVCVGLADGIED